MFARVILSFALFVMSVAMAVDCSGAENQWEGAIKRFEAFDQKKFPPADEILFVGSSSFAFWHTLAEDMQPFQVIPRGFGGSTSADVIYFFDRIVKPYKPRQVMIYEGANDMAQGETPAEAFADYKKLVGMIHREFPDATVVYVSIRPSRTFEAIELERRLFNQMVLEYCEQDDRLGYIDGDALLLDDTGRADLGLLSADELHLSKTGYEAWGPLLKARLLKKSHFIRGLAGGKKQSLLLWGQNRQLPLLASMLQAELRKKYGSLVSVKATVEAGLPDADALQTADAVVVDGSNLSEKPDELAEQIAGLQKADCEITVMLWPLPERDSRQYAEIRKLAQQQNLIIINFCHRWNKLFEKDAALAAQRSADGTFSNKALGELFVPTAIKTLQGRQLKANALPCGLDRLHVTTTFTEPLYRGRPTVLQLPVENKTLEPIRFSAEWEAEGQGEWQASPARVSDIEVAPGQTKVLEFRMAIDEQSEAVPYLDWTATNGKKQVTGQAAALVVAGGYYCTSEKDAEKVRLEADSAWQVKSFNGEWGGPEDCSASGWLCRKDDGLLVRVDVTDDAHFEDGEHPWNKDAVELFFDLRPENERAKMKTSPGCLQVFAVPSAKKEATLQFASPQDNKPVPGARLKTGRTAAGYWVEVFLPFAGLESAGYGVPGESFYFTFSVDDSDKAGTIKQQLRWAGVGADHLTPGFWGLFTEYQGK